MIVPLVVFVAMFQYSGDTLVVNAILVLSMRLVAATGAAGCSNNGDTLVVLAILSEVYDVGMTSN